MKARWSQIVSHCETNGSEGLIIKGEVACRSNRWKAIMPVQRVMLAGRSELLLGFSSNRTQEGDA